MVPILRRQLAGHMATTRPQPCPPPRLPVRSRGAGRLCVSSTRVCVSTWGCVGTALPIACTTSAAVRFRTLALTLKVTAGPRTLEETRESSEPPQYPEWLLCGHTENTDTLRTRVRPLPVAGVTSGPRRTLPSVGHPTDPLCSRSRAAVCVTNPIDPKPPTRTSRGSRKGNGHGDGV